MTPEEVEDYLDDSAKHDHQVIPEAKENVDEEIDDTSSTDSELEPKKGGNIFLFIS